jgi:TPR repeat protein
MRSNKSTMVGSMLLVALIGSAQAGPYEQALLAKDSGDFSKARTVLQPLALQGDANSQFQLSLLLRNGQGGPVDNQGAIKWLRLAQSNLGAAYSRGWGVPQNAVRAVVWFTLAAASGSKEAQTNREVALRRMTLQDISQANDIAKDCLQKNLNSCD